MIVVIRFYSVFTLLLLAVLVCLYFVFGFHQSAPLIGAIVGALLLISFYSAARIYAMRGSAAINALLRESCDPDTYLDAYTSISKGIAGHVPRQRLQMLRLCIAMGHIARGEFDAADETLEAPLEFSAGRKGSGMRALHHSLLFDIAMHREKYADARVHLEAYEQVLNDMTRKATQRYENSTGLRAVRRMRGPYARMLFRLQTAQGNMDGAQEAFTALMKNAACEYDRVRGAFELGKVQMHSGKAKDAREAFEYVQSRGEKLHIASLAKELAQQL